MHYYGCLNQLTGLHNQRAEGVFDMNLIEQLS